MSAVTEGRARQLDSVLDQSQVTEAVADDLFGVVDVLGEATALRRALSDPDATAGAKTDLVERLFGARLSAPAVAVVKEAASLRWSSMGALVAGIERQAARAALKQAEAAGQLDQVADDLFHFNRIVADDDGLRETLTDARIDRTAREQLVDQLLQHRTSPVVVVLAKRALRARHLADALAGYGSLAAQLRDRSVAKVVAAVPLSPEQEVRLRAALVKQVGREVDLQVRIDPSVLGGLTVRIGDEVIEGTVAHRLEDARRQLA
ncbi:F0F1 ATP synthase subunit delta [Aestuariimicrobium sp. T2.26MG-19.2B]|uniref:F0F1 ATP synthase subunit delta n=1 Tax=Aestuariimicrobium sp. T2.26MG-19.2B TaxID=3040679 RepID=UPI002477A152|nr:F0F1 ATP synthase subunit delta [Aestuariimicrobium sp. T2.26MG-19.2B]CAI9410385.1 ATP synthase subunit delta [Aestuariimicrobium sp. T2.26MG-19.2B]